MIEGNHRVILSVVVATFNRWEGVEKTVRSLLAQDLSEMEIIVVDDCSSVQASQELLDFFELSQVVFVRHETNKGLPAARNTGLAIANGLLFSFCDDDDCWVPGSAIRVIERFTDSEFPVDIVIAVDPSLSRSCSLFQKKSCSLRELFIAGVTPPVGSQFFRTKIVKSVGGYNVSIKSGVDHDLWVRLVTSRDFKVSTLEGPIALVSQNYSVDRMTLDKRRRLSGIALALDLWRADLVETFGIGFYSHFRKEYYLYVRGKLIFAALRRGALVDAIQLFQRPGDLRYSLRRIPLFRSIFGSCGSFSKYKGTLK
jgi:glycosyltransferase involved in cell wall biosynthesis